jgi:protein-tyrosine phosphatase
MSLQNFHKVIPGLFIGDIACASNRSFLLDHDITHILICAREAKPKFPNDFKYCKLDVVDMKWFDLCPYLEQALDFISTALSSGENVFVHCNKGISRSSAIVIAFLIGKCGMTYEKASRHLSKVHPISCPNSAFALQLKIFESKRVEVIKGACTCIVF